MRIKSISIIVALLVVIVTSVNVYQKFGKKNNEIFGLRLTVEELDKRNKNLQTSLDFLNGTENLHFKQKYVLYFPRAACSSCLEDIVLILSKEAKIWNNILLYFDTKETEELIAYLSDSYNLEFKYEIGKPLHENELNDIFFFKLEKFQVKNIFVLNQDNIIEFQKLMKSANIINNE